MSQSQQHKNEKKWKQDCAKISQNSDNKMRPKRALENKLLRKN